MTLKQTMGVQSRLILSAVCLLLVFGVGSASAQNDICDLLNFCDRDGDTLIRNHHKCELCLEPGEEFDCDDSDPTNACDGGPSVEYTAELRGGFVFTNASNPDNVRVINDMNLEEGNRLRSLEPAWMFRPLAGFCSFSNDECDEDAECPPDETCEADPGQNTWDQAFEEVCPGLFEPEAGGESFVVPDIYATPDRWAIIFTGGIRVSLRDFRLEVNGELWEIWIQLIGLEYAEAPFLPPVGEPSVFSLPTVSMWGKPVNKKGRSSDCIGGPLPQAPLLTPSVLIITAKEP